MCEYDTFISYYNEKRGQGKMKDLYFIMYEFLTVETELNALRTVISVMAAGYEEQRQQELLDVLNVFERYLECVSTDIRNSISLLDEFLVDGKGK